MITCMYGDCDVYWSVVARKGRVTSASPRNLGEVALEESELSLAFGGIRVLRAASQPVLYAIKRSTHTRLLEPSRLPPPVYLVLIVCRVISLGSSIRLW